MENEDFFSAKENKRVCDQAWRSGIMGVIVGDALGCPVQFESRREVAGHPVTDMRGGGVFDTLPGTWTDDGSLTLATLDSIRRRQKIDLQDIMHGFSLWLTKGKYTQDGAAFDIGRGTMDAIVTYMQTHDVNTCGGRGERNNGNGSLMRIMPACLYCCEMELPEEEAVALIHAVSVLTHAHVRSKAACGLYYFLVRSILQYRTEHPENKEGREENTLIRILQRGLDEGFAFYKKEISYLTELSVYGRLNNLFEMSSLPPDAIQSTGYVVDTLEAAVWSLCKTGNFKDALIVAVNLGDDTDTVGAVCGGLAGLYYGYEDIPDEWIGAIRQHEDVEKMCEKVL